jgi:tRNA (guanine-N7-)-methyltransferase
LPVPTERETYVLNQGLPVYRVLYERNDAQLPELQQLEQWMEAADKQTDNPLDSEAPTA